MSIGHIEDIRDGHVWLHEVDPQGQWHAQGYRLGAITLITMRSEYLRALTFVLPSKPSVAEVTNGFSLHRRVTAVLATCKQRRA